MSAVYPGRFVEVNLNNVWTDITAYVVSNIKGLRGISGYSPIDRVAGTGTLEFTLNNQDKRFTPFSPTVLTGWQKGAEVRVRLTLDYKAYVIWRGIIDDIDLQSGEFSDKHAIIKCVDWMNLTATFPISIAQSTTNKKANEGIALVLATLPVQPNATSFAPGTETFATIFDTVKTNTKALSEFSKLIMSEYGYLYYRHTDGTLVVESRHSRDSGIAEAIIPVGSASSSYLTTESAERLLTESGEYIRLDESQTLTFDNLMTNLDADYGGNVLNHVATRTYPRYVDPAVTVLFRQDAVIKLAAGETKYNIKGSYKDVYGAVVNGANMITPVITTDYKMYVNSNGTGTDLSANLAISVSLGTEGVIFNSINNSGITDGYVTLLNVRGNAVYTYNTVEQFVEDSSSILANGYKELIIEQKYSSSLLPTATLATIILNREKNPKVKAAKSYFLANNSYELCMAFIRHDIGSLIKVIENEIGINNYYFIQNISFDIQLDGMIYFDWGLIGATSLSESYWKVGTVGSSELATTTYVGY